MDNAERMFRRLVATLETNAPEYLTRPFEVGELYQSLLPYRHHRRELGLETNQDYELALTELLSGAGGYLIVDERMRDALSRELSSSNPDPAAFREFATAQVAISPAALQRVRESSSAAPAEVPAAQPQPIAPARPTIPPPPAAPRPSAAGPRPSTPVPAVSSQRASAGFVVDAGAECRYCGGALPAGRRITFCPHCGQNLTMVNCPACGTELDAGWKFCTTCGRRNSANA